MPELSQVSDAIQKAVNEDAVFLRFEVLVRTFERIKSALDLRCGGATPIRINKKLLFHAVYSYFYDIERVKHFHGMKRINEAKKAAYLTKWIIRMKPIYFDDSEATDKTLTSEMLIFNEFFAFRSALAYAEIPLSAVSDGTLDVILYQFAYRDIEPGLLSILFEMLIAQTKQAAHA